MASFDLNAALAGATLLVSGHSTWTVTDFCRSSPNSPLPYQAIVKGKITYFTSAGVSRDNTMTLIISDEVIDDSIASMKGDTITRGLGSSYTIISLNYREQVAVRMLQAMLPTMGNVLSFDDAKIKNLVSRAFYIATEFTNQAIEIRNANSTEPQTDLEINPSELTDYTDQILYNIMQSVKKGVAIKGEVVEAGSTATPIITKLHTDSEVAVTSMPTTDVNVISMPEEGGE